MSKLQMMLFVLYLIILLHASSSTYMSCFVSSGSSSTSLWPAKILLTNVKFLWILLKVLYSFLILMFSFFWPNQTEAWILFLRESNTNDKSLGNNGKRKWKAFCISVRYFLQFDLELITCQLLVRWQFQLNEIWWDSTDSQVCIRYWDYFLNWFFFKTLDLLREA